MSINMVKLMTYLSNGTSDLHLGTDNDRNNPNLLHTRNKNGIELDEIQIKKGKNTPKVKNRNNNRILFFCIDNTDLSCQRVKSKGARRLSQIISEIVLTAKKILLKFLTSPNNMVSEKIVLYVQNRDGNILRISQSYLLPSMGL